MLINSIDVSGLKDLATYFEKLPELASESMAMALNTVSGGTGLTKLRTLMYGEVNFPKGYLNDPSRLGQSKKANPRDLTAAITGRGRATSLAEFVPARFVAGSSAGKGGLQVKVSPDDAKTMDNSWLINLRNDNIGLALRVHKGAGVAHKYGPPVKLKKASEKSKKYDIYLLYGPSVDQVMGTITEPDDKTHYNDDVSDMIVKEFMRVFAWKSETYGR